MKKYLIMAILALSTTSLAAQAICFKAIEVKTGNVLYGKTKAKDFSSVDVSLQDKNRETVCEGFGFPTSVKGNTSPKVVGINSFAKLSCSDGRLMELSWKTLTSGEAIDQYKSVYLLSSIKKKEYKKNIQKNGTKKIEHKL